MLYWFGWLYQGCMQYRVRSACFAFIALLFFAQKEIIKKVRFPSIAIELMNTHNSLIGH